jgi:hypothetical protein
MSHWINEEAEGLTDGPVQPEALDQWPQRFEGDE